MRRPDRFRRVHPGSRHLNPVVGNPCTARHLFSIGSRGELDRGKGTQAQIVTYGCHLQGSEEPAGYTHRLQIDITWYSMVDPPVMSQLMTCKQLSI